MEILYISAPSSRYFRSASCLFSSSLRITVDCGTHDPWPPPTTHDSTHLLWLNSSRVLTDNVWHFLTLFRWFHLFIIVLKIKFVRRAIARTLRKKKYQTFAVVRLYYGICRCLCAHSAGRANVCVPELLIKYVVSKGLEKIAANENKESDEVRMWCLQHLRKFKIFLLCRGS